MIKMVTFLFCIFYCNFKKYKKQSYLPPKLCQVGMMIEAGRSVRASLFKITESNLRVGLDDNSFCCRVGLQQVLASDKRQTTSSPTQWEADLMNLPA